MIVLTENQSDIIDEMIENPDKERLYELQWLALDLLRKAVGVLEGLTPTARAEVGVAIDDLLDAVQWTVCSDGFYDRRGLAEKCRHMAGVLTKVVEE